MSSYPASAYCPVRCGFMATVEIIFLDLKPRNLRICPRCGAVKDRAAFPLTPDTGDLPWIIEREERGHYWTVLDKATGTPLGQVEPSYQAVAWVVPNDDEDDSRRFRFQTPKPLAFWAACWAVYHKGLTDVLGQYIQGGSRQEWTEVPDLRRPPTTRTPWP